MHRSAADVLHLFEVQTVGHRPCQRHGVGLISCRRVGPRIQAAAPSLFALLGRIARSLRSFCSSSRGATAAMHRHRRYLGWSCGDFAQAYPFGEVKAEYVAGQPRVNIATYKPDGKTLWYNYKVPAGEQLAVPSPCPRKAGNLAVECAGNRATCRLCCRPLRAVGDSKQCPNTTEDTMEALLPSAGRWTRPTRRRTSACSRAAPTSRRWRRASGT